MCAASSNRKFLKKKNISKFFSCLRRIIYLNFRNVLVILVYGPHCAVRWATLESNSNWYLADAEAANFGNKSISKRQKELKMDEFISANNTNVFNFFIWRLSARALVFNFICDFAYLFQLPQGKWVTSSYSISSFYKSKVLT